MTGMLAMHTSGGQTVSFAEFSELVANLASWARGRGFRVPGIQSPPRVPGADRVLRRTNGEVRTIAVVVRGRGRVEVVTDVVSGILLANAVPRSDWSAVIDDALAAVGAGSVGPSWACAA